MLENAKRWVNPINTSNKAKKIRRSMMAGLATFAVAVLLFAQIVLSADEAKMPAQESLYARSAALIDGDTGRLLYGKEEDVILPMASTTKIMTCILVLEMMEPEEICTASAYAASQPQVHLGVQKGWSFRCEDLLYSLMLESHNDTAVILAEAAAGSVEGFATWMNKKAKEIGLSQTHFVTPNGLDNEAHYTTARELALLLRYCIRTSTKSKEFLKITRTAQYEFTDTTGKYSFSVYNHNAFLQMMDGALTGKTGFTGKAGYCYEWADTKKLMNYGLSAYETKKLETPAVPKMSASVIDGVYDWTKQTKSQVKLICPDAPDKYQVLAKDGEKIEIQIRARKELASPVLEGEVCGEVSFWLSEVCLGTYPIYPEQAVDKRAFVWYIMRVLSLLL